ncbi:MAG: isopeptide-forming domain-containing fimbrial protein [Clostridiales bacterium]|nr:isopeptide-forming domain-containing fimbrial protein [Clostridiales bacterium]
MKKTTKKLSSIVMAMILVLSLMVTAGMPVLAAGNDGKITITNPTGYPLTGMTVDAYLVLEETDTATGADSKAVYTVTEDFAAFFAQAKADYNVIKDTATDIYVTYDTTGNQLKISDTNSGGTEGTDYITFSNSVKLDSTYFEADLVSRITDQSTSARLLSDWLTKYIIAKSLTTSNTITATADTQQFEFTGLTRGYYALVSSNVPVNIANLQTILQVAGETQVALKADSVPLTKEVDEVTESDGWGKTESAGVGETVKYQITTALPDLTNYNQSGIRYEYKIEDTIKNQMINENSIRVTIGGQALTQLIDYVKEGYTDLVGDYTAGTQTLTLNFDVAKLREFAVRQGLLGQEAVVVLTYNAELTSDAVLKNDNDVTLTYTTDPYHDYTQPVEDTATVYTYGIDVDKTFSDDSLAANYASVKFELRTGSAEGTAVEFIQKDETYIVADTDDTGETSLSITALGDLYLYGLDEGTYYLVETSTANGFVLLDPVTITLGAMTTPTAKTALDENTSSAMMGDTSVTRTTELTTDENQSVINLELLNQKGFNLPTTGGVGTWMFTIGGVLLIAVALALYFVSKKKKMSTNK